MPQRKSEMEGDGYGIVDRSRVACIGTRIG